MKDPDGNPSDSSGKSPSSRSRAKGGLRSQIADLEGRLGNAELLLEISQRMAACNTSDESLETFLEIMVEQTRHSLSQ
jgi:hypothetical protein